MLKRPEKTNSNKPITLENIDLDSFQGTLQAEATSTSEPDAIPNELPLNQEDLNIENTELPVSESPFPALPFDSTPPFQEINSASDNPFAPLPDGLPPLDPINDGGNVPPPDPFGL